MRAYYIVSSYKRTGAKINDDTIMCITSIGVRRRILITLGYCVIIPTRRSQVSFVRFP